MADTNKPTASPQQALSTIGLNDAAEAFGISVDTLRRRIKSEQLPEAQLTQGKFGETYELPTATLAQIAEREQWVLDLNVLSAQGSPSAAHPQELIHTDLIEQLIDAKASAETSSRQLDETTKRLDQTSNDLEMVNAEVDRLAQEVVALEKSLAVADARTEEIRQRAAIAEKASADAAQERDSLDQLHRELQKTSAEASSVASADLAASKTETETVAGERDELTKRLADAEASMGWWTRRKYRR